MAITQAANLTPFVETEASATSARWTTWLLRLENYFIVKNIRQGCPTRGPRAICGPPKLSKWPVKLSTLVS